MEMSCLHCKISHDLKFCRKSILDIFYIDYHLG